MYKLLIVEDEDMLRDALLNSIDWKALNYETLGAEDGERGLSIAMEFKPDIVLTDIRMPFMDGLELSKALRTLLPDVEIAILSGHDEFAYAQEAIKIGVREYLTKPVRPDALIELVKRLERLVDATRSRNLRLEKSKELLKHSMPAFRQKLLTQMLEYPQDEETLNERMALIGMSMKGERYTVCLMEYEFNALKPSDTPLMECAVYDMLTAEFGYDAQVLELSRGGLAIIYCAKTSDIRSERAYLKEWLETVCVELSSELDVSATVGVGVPVKRLSALPASYQSAYEAMQQQVLYGKYRIYDVYECEVEQARYPFDEVRAVLNQIKSGTPAGVEEELKRLFSDIRAAGYMSEQNLRVVMVDLINGACKLLMEAQKADDAEISRMYSRLFTLTTLDDYARALAPELLRIQKLIDESEASRGDKLVKSICDYIDEHFCEADMSLNSVASHVYISPTYLSILFKKKLGVTFIDYVISLRMKRARELLRISNLRTYEVAARSGYNDPQYFSGCFKKYVGLTPTEYRNREREGDR